MRHLARGPADASRIDDSDDESPVPLPRGLSEVIEYVVTGEAKLTRHSLVTTEDEGSDDEAKPVVRAREVIECVAAESRRR